MDRGRWRMPAVPAGLPPAGPPPPPQLFKITKIFQKSVLLLTNLLGLQSNPERHRYAALFSKHLPKGWDG